MTPLITTDKVAPLRSHGIWDFPVIYYVFALPELFRKKKTWMKHSDKIIPAAGA